MANAFHHLEAADRAPFLRRLAREVARRGTGRLALLDWFPGRNAPGGRGPPNWMRLPPEGVVAELEAAGWHVESRVDDLVPWQYLLLARLA